MITALYSEEGGRPVPVASEGDIARIVSGGKGCLWVDLQGMGEEERRLLASSFQLNPLAVENCLEQTHHPRLHEYGEKLYLVFHAVQGVSPIQTGEIDIFLGPNYLVTCHREPLQEIAGLRKEALEVEGMMRRGPDRLLGELLDRVTEGYLTVMEALDNEIDGIEDRIFTRANTQALRRVFSIKKDVLHFRRIVGPQREILMRLSRGEFPAISKDDAIVFRDIYDHVYRVSEMLESFRDVLTSALEVYLTVVSNRINEVMKVLTVFSIIIMSASLLAGIYGMNVDLPLAKTPGVFYIVVGAMGVMAAALLVFFKRRRWI